MLHYMVDQADDFGFEFGGDAVAAFADFAMARKCCEEVARLSGKAARVRDKWGRSVVYSVKGVTSRESTSEEESVQAVFGADGFIRGADNRFYRP